MNSSLPFKSCVVIPVYRHAHYLPPLLAAIKALGLYVILVNDGDPSASEQLKSYCQSGAVELLEQFPNQGKGTAVLAGFAQAALLKFSHALQIDADGQHQASDIPRLLAAATTYPHAVVTGVPIYDQSVPKHRLYARYLTHVWVWVHTLSLSIRDSMCGFRVYPLAPTLALHRDQKIGTHMNFDTDILVRLYWRGIKVISVPTEVTYPADGYSNFRPLKDNVLISWMHTKLFFGMLIRSPILLWRKCR